MSFDNQDDVNLVQMVSRHPSIYDTQNALYKDAKIRNAAWAEISSVLGKNVYECKRRWKNIKDTRRKKAKRKLNTRSFNGKSWQLEDMLHFLNNIDDKKSSTTNESVSATNSEENDNTLDLKMENFDVEELDVKDIEVDPLAPGNSQPRRRITRKRKTNNFNSVLVNLLKEQNDVFKMLLEEKNGRSDHPVNLFCDSIALSLKSLPQHLCNEGKIKIVQLIAELEQRHVNEAT